MTTTIISSGTTSSGLTVIGGEVAQVQAGGTLASSTVSNGGQVLLSSGGLVSAIRISAGGVLTGSGVIDGNDYDAGILRGGQLGDANTYDYGSLEVASGGVASGVTVAEGTLTINVGGTISGTILADQTDGQNYDTVYGRAVATQIGERALEDVLSGGIASSAVVGFGGFQVVESRGIASGTALTMPASPLLALAQRQPNGYTSYKAIYVTLTASVGPYQPHESAKVSPLTNSQLRRRKILLGSEIHAIKRQSNPKWRFHGREYRVLHGLHIRVARSELPHHPG